MRVQRVEIPGDRSSRCTDSKANAAFGLLQRVLDILYGQHHLPQAYFGVLAFFKNGERLSVTVESKLLGTILSHKERHTTLREWAFSK